MGTEISVYGNPSSAWEFIERTGDMIAKSQFAGVKSKEQGQFLAMTCLARGRDPLSIAQVYDVIQGKLRMKSVIMLSRFRRLGGQHTVIDRTAERAAIRLTLDGSSHDFAITWDEAQEEGFTEDRKGDTKENYATPRKRMQMLWYRVVSDGVSVMAPEVLDDDDLDGSSTAIHTGPSAPAGGDSALPPPAANAGTQPRNDATVIDAQYTVVNETPTRESVAATSQSGDSQAEATPGIDATNAIDDPRGESTSIRVDEPCTSDQQKRIRDLIAELKNDGVPDIAKRVKAKLVKHGLNKLEDLTIAEADHIAKLLGQKKVEAWAEFALVGHQAVASGN